MSEYSVVFHFAHHTSKYYKSDGSIGTSAAGHVWYEVYKPGETKPLSYGWAPSESDGKGGGTKNIMYDDYLRYIDRGDNISSIKINITAEQAEKFIDFPKKVIQGQIPLFDSSSYNLVKNSCVDFAAQALAYAGLADKDFQGRAVAYPSAQFGTFLSQIVKHQVQNNQENMGLSIKVYGETYTLKPEEKNKKAIQNIFDNLEQKSLRAENNFEQLYKISFPEDESDKLATKSINSVPITPAQDMVNQLFAAYTSGDKDALSSVVANHAYTQQRNQEVSEQVQQLKEAEQQRMAEQLAEVQQVEQRHRMVRS